MSDETHIPVFRYSGTYQHKAGTVYFGPMPFDGSDWKVEGKPVTVDGEVRTIRAMEAHRTTAGPNVGDPVGFLFEDLEGKK